MRSALAVVGSLSLLSAMGCAMCGSPHDYSYAAFGGKVQRTDRVCGRVGSVLDPAGQPSGLASAETIVSPMPVDEQIFEPSWEPESDLWQPERADSDFVVPPTNVGTPLPQSESGEPSDSVPWETLPMPSELEPGAPLPDMDAVPGGY